MMLGNLKRGNDAEELKLIFNPNFSPPYKDLLVMVPVYLTLTHWGFLGLDQLIIGLLLRDLFEHVKLVLLQNKISLQV
jgi:hypothetical protein